MPRLGWGTGKDDDRGRSAPMQGVEYERPMDPGPFQVPNKREFKRESRRQGDFARCHHRHRHRRLVC